MKLLTKEQIAAQAKSKTWSSVKSLCVKFGNNYGVNPDVLLSIFTIETFYRPVMMRVVEYCVVLLGCMRCLLLKIPTKNRTIGSCQLGLATILNFYGGNHYQHSHKILISSFSEVRQIFSVTSKERAIEILAYRLQPITHRAICIFPNLRENRIRYIGEQFNVWYAVNRSISPFGIERQQGIVQLCPAAPFCTKCKLGGTPQPCSKEA